MGAESGHIQMSLPSACIYIHHHFGFRTGNFRFLHQNELTWNTVWGSIGNWYKSELSVLTVSVKY